MRKKAKKPHEIPRGVCRLTDSTLKHPQPFAGLFIGLGVHRPCMRHVAVVVRWWSRTSQPWETCVTASPEHARWCPTCKFYPPTINYVLLQPPFTSGEARVGIDSYGHVYVLCIYLSTLESQILNVFARIPKVRSLGWLWRLSPGSKKSAQTTRTLYTLRSRLFGKKAVSFPSLRGQKACIFRTFPVNAPALWATAVLHCLLL